MQVLHASGLTSQGDEFDGSCFAVSLRSSPCSEQIDASSRNLAFALFDVVIYRFYGSPIGEQCCFRIEGFCTYLLLYVNLSCLSN